MACRDAGRFVSITRRPLTDAEEAAVNAGLSANAAECGAPPYHLHPFGLIKHDDAGNMIGGLSGHIAWNWLYIDLLWVDKAHRGEDLGTALMTEAEACARGEGLTGYHLTTQSWEALGFYQKMGLTLYAEIKDLPPGHTRYFLRKYLDR